MSADLVVLVVLQGVLVADVSETLAVLETFGVSPNWAILVSSHESTASESASVAPHSHPSPFRRKESLGRKEASKREQPPVSVVTIAPDGRLGPTAKQRRAKTLGARDQDAHTPARAADQS